MLSTLMPLAVAVGAPVIERILSDKIGTGNAGLVRRVIETIAEQAGTTPDKLEDLARASPELVQAAIQEAERMSPDLVALYGEGLEYQMAILDAERDGPLWTRAWRPGGMYLIGFLWLWNVVLLHVFNAVFKIALPAMDAALLFQLSALYLGLYMGGHTVKDIAARKWGGVA